MDPPSLLLKAAAEIATRSARRAVHHMRLRDLGLTLAHAGWVVVVLLDIAIFVPGVLSYHRLIFRPCASTTPYYPAAPCALGQLTPDGIQALHHLGLSLDAYAVLALAIVLSASAVFFAVGALIAWRTWQEGMGLFVSLVLITFGATGLSDSLLGSMSLLPPDLGPRWGILVMGIGTGIICVQWPALGAFLLTFPTGRFIPRWSWLVIFLWITTVLAFLLPVPLLVTTSSIALTFGSTLAVQVYRYRQVYAPVQRQQTKWLVFSMATALGLLAVVIVILAFVSALNTPDVVLVPIARLLASATLFASALFFLPIAVAVGIALLRYRLYNIDLLINRTLVYSALTAGIVGIYVLIVGYLSAAFRTSGNLLISLVATGVVAVLFQPLRAWLQRGVNRLLFGERDNPYSVLERLDRRLALAIPAETVLPTIVETVATALKLPYAAITLMSEPPQSAAASGDAMPHRAERATLASSSLRGIAERNPHERNPHERIAASYGTPTATEVRLPLAYGAETLGYLDLVPRPGDTEFTAVDRRLLESLAAHAGVVVHAIRLTTELQRARERLVTAREEERRRLRRDLHDGLGPQLASLTLSLAAAREFLSHDPAAADTLLHELTQHVQGAVADVRRLVYELRPPALDDLGLLGALRDQAVRYSQGGLLVTVDAPPSLAALPAAVEVAAYRICLEALTNVVRHANARACVIRLCLDPLARELRVEIVGDGAGIRRGAAGGVGLRSMRERAEELGGSCVIRPLPGGGTSISARLPVAK